MKMFLPNGGNSGIPKNGGGKGKPGRDVPADDSVPPALDASPGRGADAAKYKMSKYHPLAVYYRKQLRTKKNNYVYT